MNDNQHQAGERRIDALLRRPVTRKQFLSMLFSGIAGVMGFSGIMGLLAKNQPVRRSTNPGYGEQRYGP